MSILTKLTRLEKEAVEFGFKWETPQQIKEQILSEVAEIDVHLEDLEQLIYDLNVLLNTLKQISSKE